jgi:hypothetical protein
MSDNNDIVIFDHSVLDEESITRVDRSGVIEPGHHWFCTKNVSGIHTNWENHAFGFSEGLAYLLTNLIFFDGKLHSVELLDDPSVGKSSGILTLPLLLENFEPMTEEAAKALRQTQMQAVHALAADVQKDMAEAMSNPLMLEGVIAKGLAEWEAELASRNRREDEEDEDAKPKAQLPALTTNGQFNLMGAVNHRISSTDIAVFRHMAQREGKIAEIRGKWLQKKAEQLADVLKGLAPFYSEHAAVGMARAHEALSRVKDVEKGLRSLNLYTGDGVRVVTVVEGASAPSNEPLTVYQRKLFMAEEFAVWDDVDRMFDAGNAPMFFQALSKNESLREQLIPAQRGVVAMAIRSDDVKYDPKTLAEALDAMNRNRENKALFLLVRDGGNWYQVFSEEPSHELSPRLFPTRNEMSDIFAGIDGERIDFADLRFTNRTNEFDAKSLAYKRFLILACGLDHRSKLFGDFYPEAEALSFISMDFQRKYMRFISDDDSDFMLGDGLPSVHSLIEQNHAQLAPGCRVLVFSRDILSEPDACPGAYNNGSYEHGRGTVYSLMVKPVHKAMLLTVHRHKDDLVVSLPVERINTETRKGWGNYEPIKRTHFSVRVALNKLKGLVGHVKGSGLGFLITDTLRAEELRPYIYSRAQRAHQWDYIYGFKLAMKMLADEEAVNAPVMDKLQEEAKVRFGLAPAAAGIAASTAAQSWRLKNPDANTLPSAPCADLDFQLAEAAYAFTHAIPLVQKHITALGGKVIRILRGKKGQLAAYYEQPDAEKDLRITPWRWVGRRTYTAAGKPTKDEPQTVWLMAGCIIGETELYGVPSDLAHRMRERDEQLPSIKAKLQMTEEMAEILADAFKGERQGVSDRAWLALTAPNVTESKNSRNARGKNSNGFSRDAEALLPVTVDTKYNMMAGVRIPLYDTLYFYGSDAQRAALIEKGYTLPKPKKGPQGEKLPNARPHLWAHVVESFAPSQFTGPVGNDCYVSPFNDYDTGPYQYDGADELNVRFNYLMGQGAATSEERKARHTRTKVLDSANLWFPPSLLGEDGTAAISRLFPGLQDANLNSQADGEADEE